MADQLDSQIKDTLSIENAKTIAGGSAFATNNLHQMVATAVGMSIQNAVNEQARQQALGNAVLIGLVNKFTNIDPEQALALSRSFTGHDVARDQQAIKAAQTTPPVTAPPPATS